MNHNVTAIPGELLKIAGICNNEECEEGSMSGYCTKSMSHFDPYKLKIICSCGNNLTMYALSPEYKQIHCTCGKSFIQRLEDKKLYIGKK